MRDTQTLDPLRVFLCHSSHDKVAVRNLRTRLIGDGFTPWLDEFDIPPGANWDHEIRNALRSADAVVVCLSQSSTYKSGYVQREITFVLDAAEEKPPGSVFIIPARLDECSVPDRLARWQYVNLFTSEGYSRLSAALREQRLQSYLSGFMVATGHERLRFGERLIDALGTAAPMVKESAAGLTATLDGLLSADSRRRVSAALALTHRCYASRGQCGALPPQQQDALIEALVAALGLDGATRTAAMWALLWLTGAKYRDRRHLPANAFIRLSPQHIDAIEHCMRQSSQDSNILAHGSLVLATQEGLQTVINQRDWIRTLAAIADGAQLRRTLAAPESTGRTASFDWLQDILRTAVPLATRARVAQALGAFGHYDSEMTQPLSSLFLSSSYATDERDEALVYLVFTRAQGAVRVLIDAADSPPRGDDDYLYARGLFGLLLLDDVHVLANQMQKALPHSDLNAYAYGLAGSRNALGLELLHQLARHPNREIAVAAANGLALPAKLSLPAV